MGNVKVGLVKKDLMFGIKTPFEYKDKCRKLEFRRWDKVNRIWTVPATLDMLRSIFAVFGEEDVDLTDLVREMLVEWTERVNTFRSLKGRIDYTMGDVTYRTRVRPLDDGTPTEPRGYQIAGTLAMLCQPKVFLQDEMGLGKTRQSIDTAVAHMDRGDILRAIVIVPATLKYTWGGSARQRIEGEIQKWAPAEYGAHDQVLVIDGTPSQRSKQLLYAHAYRWIILNYELVDKHKESLAKLADGQMVILDEVHRVKNPKATSTKAVLTIKPAYEIAMTGTPVANKPEDVWQIAEMVSPGSLGSLWGFLDKYTERGGYEGHEILRYVNLDDMHRRLDQFSIRRTKAQCLPQLPPKVYSERHVEMAADQAREYKRMSEEMVAEYANMPETDFKLHAAMALSQLLRLQQIADGFIAAEGHDPQWFEEQPKLAALDEIVEEVVADGGGKLVVWSRFRPATDAIVKRYAKCGSVGFTGSLPKQQRAGTVERFMTDPDTRIFVGQVETGGVGITLTSAQVQVFYDLWWSPSVVKQAEDRLHRIGTRGTVSVIRLLCRESIDENVLKMLGRKSHWADVITGDQDSQVGRELFLNLLMGDNAVPV